MRSLRRYSAFLFSALLMMLVHTSLRAQDTVVVQTLTYDSVGRVGVFHFPEVTPGTTYEKVLMQYRIRCHHALVSNGTNTEQGCGQWDYNCETYITDSSRTDSIKQLQTSAIISSYPANTNFPYVTTPTYNYVKRDEKIATYTTTQQNGFQSITLGNGLSRIAQPLGASSPAARTFYILTATELKAQNVGTTPIAGIGLSVANAGSALRAMRIRMRLTTSLAVDESLTRDTGYTTVYYATTPAPSGNQNFYFFQPYTWDGTSNVVIEVSYTNLYPGIDNVVSGGSVGFPSSLTTSSNESALKFSGAEGIAIASNNFNHISNEITISAWTNGDTSVLPANSALFEGADNQNHRQVNAHLPWSDGNIYWDCGGDANGFDRISHAVAKQNIAGRWNHWAFTKNAVTGSMKIFLNGSLFWSDTGKHRPINLTQLELGASVTSILNYYGQISRFSVWNKALDSTSVKRIMMADISQSDSNIGSLLAYYKLTEGQGTTLYDSSSAHAVSYLAGAPVWSKVRGSDLYTNFTASSIRPNLVLLTPSTPMTPTVTDSYVTDSVLNNAHSVTRFAIVRDDSIRVVDTTYKWLATKSYILDEKGDTISSSPIAATDTVRITQLPYFQKWPQKLEIMSFVTPYGINLDLGKAGKLYEFEVTDYLPILNGWRKLSMERGSGQEEFDLRFLFIKGTPARNVLDIQQIWPMTEEPYANIYSGLRYEPRKVYLNPNAKAFKMRSMITGHGAVSQTATGGEFTIRQHWVTVNASVYQWWVDKVCAINPMYPQGGTWTYERAGWCPGAPTLETEYELTGTINPGDSALFHYGVIIDTANGGVPGDSRYDPSHQLVSYGAPNFNLNAGIVEIKRPSDRIAYGRINPACDLPIVVIRNNGSQALTSLHFDYYVTHGPHQGYDWKGKLNFLDTQSVTLPVDSLGFWTAGDSVFHVDISLPNGSTDQYDQDNHFTSTYAQPAMYKGSIVINYHTNNQPQDNYYEVLNLAGDTVFQITDTLSANTLYNDSLALPVGCYTLRFHDDGDDGLNYWANTAQGSDGYLRLRQTSKTGKVLTTMNPDFGRFVQYDFSITQSSLDVTNPPVAYQWTSIYPNPAHDFLNVQLAGFINQRFRMEIVDELGRIISSEDKVTDGSGRLKTKLDVHFLAEGHYLLRMISNEATVQKAFVIE